MLSLFLVLVDASVARGVNLADDFCLSAKKFSRSDVILSMGEVGEETPE